MLTNHFVLVTFLQRSTMQWQEQTGVEKQNLSNALTKAQKKINEQTGTVTVCLHSIV